MGIKKTQLKRADKQKEFAQHERNLERLMWNPINISS